MKCLTCGFKNPATGSYCQKCGARMDLTADEIRDALMEKAKGETAKNTEFYAKQALLFALALVLLAVTMVVLSGGAPEGGTFIPAASKETKYVEVEHQVDVTVPKLEIPIVPRKKK